MRDKSVALRETSVTPISWHHRAIRMSNTKLRRTRIQHELARAAGQGSIDPRELQTEQRARPAHEFLPEAHEIEGHFDGLSLAGCAE